MARHLSRRLNPAAPIESFSPGDTNETPPGDCSSAGGHHCCGCGCAACWCRLTHFKKDESNREAYGGQGGHQGNMPAPGIRRPDRVSSLSFDSPSSFQSSHTLSNGSFNNSFEVPAPLDGHHRQPAAAVTPDGAQHAAAETDDDDPHPWFSFLERADSLDHMSFGEDSSGMFIPGLADDSTLARGPGSSVADRSTLSSQYESFFALQGQQQQQQQQQSTTASQNLVQVGAAFDDHAPPRFLRLTPECRHTLHHPICARCMH
ncbi:hypothetical protein CLAIMM_02332 [Cladophialophora immunda]|nr:hypothetical protein CLAIMM_02332 [Cladophialophora immunda]